MADPSLKERCNRRLQRMKEDRRAYEPDIREIASYTMPHRSRWLFSDGNKNRRQQSRRRHSGHGIWALSVLQNGMTSGLSSGSRPWFTISVQDDDLADDPEIKAWASEVERRMYAFIASTNFYSAVKTGYLELGGFGTEACIALEHSREGAVFEQLTFGEYYISTDSTKTPSALYRHCSLTALEALQKFGKDGVRQQVKDAYDRGDKDQEFEFLHAIELNDEFDPDTAGWRGMQWRSMYWDAADDRNGDDTFAGRQGYNEQPFWAPRWDTVGSDKYGIGPGRQALDDLRELQLQAKRKGEATDLHVWPEKVASSRVKLKNQPKSIITVAGTEMDVGTLIAVPYQIPYQTIGVIKDDLEGCKRQINEMTYADLFMAITNMNGVQPRNVEEIASRNEEKLTQLGPVIERVNNEKLEPAIERIFGIMQRGRLLPPAPEKIADSNLKIEFVSILTTMQRMAGLGQIERGLSFVGSLSATYPEARFKIDAFKAVDEYWSRAGAPAHILRSDDEAMEDATNEAQAAQNAQLAEAAAKLAPASKEAVQAAGLMSELPASGVPAGEALLPVLPR